jgi:pantothenate synthetase
MKNSRPLPKDGKDDPSMERAILIAIAARIGRTRLIDNAVLRP